MSPIVELFSSGRGLIYSFVRIRSDGNGCIPMGLSLFVSCDCAKGRDGRLL